MNAWKMIAISAILALAFQCLPILGYTNDSLASKPENVSKTATSSTYPSIAVDTANNPHIVWVETTAGGSSICYLRWNSQSWVNVNGEESNGANAVVFEDCPENAWPMIVTDQMNYPVIVWQQSKGVSHYARWNGSLWKNIRGDTLSRYNASINLGGFDFLATWLSLGNDGLPIVLSYNKFLKFDGTNWLTVRGQTFTGNNDEMFAMNGYLVACDIDVSDKPHIVWTNFFASNDSEGKPVTATRISYAKWDGSNWTNIKGEALDANNCEFDVTNEVMNLEMALDSTGSPHVVYSVASKDYSSFNLNYTSANGNVWQPKEIIKHPAKGSSVRPEIAIDHTDRVHLAWVEYSNSTSSLKINYIFKGNDSWVTAEKLRFRGDAGIADFSYDGDGSLILKMALNGTGNPHFTWHDRAPMAQGFKPAEVYHMTVDSSKVSTVKTTVQFTVGSLTASVDGLPEKLPAIPYIKNNLMMVPFRFLGEAIGARVSFTTDPKTKLVKSVSYESGKRQIILEIGSASALVDGNIVLLNAPPEIRKGSTYVPLRFVTDALGGTVAWDKRLRMATIVYEK